MAALPAALNLTAADPPPPSPPPVPPHARKRKTKLVSKHANHSTQAVLKHRKEPFCKLHENQCINHLI